MNARYEYVDKYKTISPCLLLFFSTEPQIRPIREHRFDEYEILFKNLNKNDPVSYTHLTLPTKA